MQSKLLVSPLPVREASSALLGSICRLDSVVLDREGRLTYLDTRVSVSGLVEVERYYA